MYITNRPEVARIAEEVGVDRLFIDMEYIGKDHRQGGMDTVQNHHTFEDIKAIRTTISKSKLQVRVNPIHNTVPDYCDTEDEVNRAIDCGADILMLPMYKSLGDVERFLRAVNGRAVTLLLAETEEAAEIMEEVVRIDEVDEIHLGLNDLHLALHKKFMFELLADGTVDRLCDVIRPSGKQFGFGGIARLGHGILPAEKVIMDHYRLGSTMAILSRSFCDANKIDDAEEIRRLFLPEVKRIRKAEKFFSESTPEQFDRNHKEVIRLVNEIVAGL